MQAIWKPAAAGNYTVGRRLPITQVTFHHIAGDALGALARFQKSGTEVSATYVIGSDGTLYQCVKESDTPYTDANGDSNARSITIEHAGGIENVPYTDAMYQTSIQLVAGLIARYGISSFKRHREVSNTPTLCPGTLDVERIVSGAKSLQGGNTVIPDRAHLDAMFQRFFGRNSTSAEQAEWIGKKTYTNLIDVLQPQQAYKDQVHYSEVGFVAVRDGWEKQIQDLQKQLDADATPLKPGKYRVS